MRRKRVKEEKELHGASCLTLNTATLPMVTWGPEVSIGIQVELVPRLLRVTQCVMLRHLCQTACVHMTYTHLPVFSNSSLLYRLQNLIQWKLSVISYYTHCSGPDTFNRNTVFKKRFLFCCWLNCRLGTCGHTEGVLH